MSLIKSAQSDISQRVRPLPLDRLSPSQPNTSVAPDPELMALRTRLKGLEDQAAARARDLERFKSEAKAAVDRARLDGRKEGEYLATNREAERLAVVEDAASRALGALTATLEQTERLACEIARTSLDKIFGDAGRFAEMATQIIQAQLKGLRAQSAIRIEVCASDFGQQGALEAIKAVAGIEVTPLEQLKAGECRIMLRLGALEVGPRQQWLKLRPLLEELAQADSPP